MRCFRARVSSSTPSFFVFFDFFFLDFLSFFGFFLERFFFERDSSGSAEVSCSDNEEVKSSGTDLAGFRVVGSLVEVEYSDSRMLLNYNKRTYGELLTFREREREREKGKRRDEIERK